MTFKATNSQVRIAIPLSKLRVAPDGSHATLHSPANAHPLKVVTGKRNLLILDFGDAQPYNAFLGQQNGPQMVKLQA